MKRITAIILMIAIMCLPLIGCAEKACSTCGKSVEGEGFSAFGKDYCEACFSDYVSTIAGNNSSETDASQPEEGSETTSGEAETSSDAETSSEEENDNKNDNKNNNTTASSKTETSNTTTSSKPQTNENEVVSSQPESNDQQPEPAVDLGGKTIKVACWWAPMPSADAATEKGRLQYLQYEEAKKNYNFNIEEIVVSQPDIRINFEASLMSGDVWADIIYMRSEQAQKFAKNGNLLDLNGLFPMENREYNQNVRKDFTIGGKTYAFTYYENLAENLIAFNKNIFDRVGLAYPYDLAKNKQWTWDIFIEYVQKSAITDPTTGMIDVYGYYAQPTLSNAEHFMYTAIGRQLVEKGADGKYYSTASDPQVLQFMNKVRDLNLLYGVYLPPENVTVWSDAPVKFKRGKVAMYAFSMAGGPSALKDMQDDWGVVPFPTMNAGESYKFMNTTQNVQVMPAALASDMKWAKQVAFVYNEIFKSPYTEAEEAKARYAEFASQLRDQESIKIVMDLTDNAPVVLSNSNIVSDSAYDYWGEISVPASKAFRGEDTVENVFTSFAQWLQVICAEAN